MYHSFFIHPSVDWHLSCFHILITVNSAAMIIGVHVYFSVIIFSGCMPNSGIVGSCGSFSPSILGNLHTVPHSACSNLHSNQQFNSSRILEWLKYQKFFCGSLFSTSSPALIVCRFFYDGHSDRYEVISHCSFHLHSVIMSNVEHLFMCLLVNCMSSLDKCLLNSSAYLLILSCISCLYILEINPSSVVSFFLPFWGLSLNLV